VCVMVDHVPGVASFRRRLRSFVLALLVLVVAVAVVIAGPARDASASLVPPVGPAVVGALGEAAVAGGEAVAAGGAVTVGGAAIGVLAVGVAAWYLAGTPGSADGTIQGLIAPGGVLAGLFGGSGAPTNSTSTDSNPNYNMSHGSFSWLGPNSFGYSVGCTNTGSTNYCGSPFPIETPVGRCLENSTGRLYNDPTSYPVYKGSYTVTNACPIGSGGNDMLLGVEFLTGWGDAGEWFPNPAAQARNIASSQVTGKATCVLDGNGTSAGIVTASGSYGDGVLPQPQCPDGSTASRIDYTMTPYGGAATTTLGTITSAVPSMYPNCVATKCLLKVSVDGVSCTVGNPDCYSWQQLTPSRVSCTYGTYTVGLVDCSPIEYAYRSGNGLTVDPANPSEAPVPALSPTNPNPDPNRGPGTAAPAPAPSTSAAPAPSPSASPSATPTPTPSPSASPSATPTPTATPAPPPGGPGVVDPQLNPTADESSCFPSGWAALNPLEWVYRPIKCALTWAFVPPPGTVQDQFSSVQTAFAVTGPGQWITGTTAVISTVASNNPGGCQGVTVSIPLPHMQPLAFSPYDACNEPVATIAGVMKLILTVGCFVGAFITILRVIASSFGLDVPVGGGDDT
jgi:hypothetical protein